jgi:hypothetical protein
VCEHLGTSGDKLIGLENRRYALLLLEKFANKYKDILKYEEE